MAKFPFERDWRYRGVNAVVAMVLALGWAAPSFAPAAALSGDLRFREYRNVEASAGTFTAEDVLITHGDSTLIRATKARHVESTGGSSELDLTGKVHIEFEGALLDADSAVLKFSGKDLLSVSVKSVKGSQAQFSHQPKGYARRVNGRADAIAFESATGKVTFSGNGSYTDERHSFTSGLVRYDINTGTVTDDGDPSTRGQAIIRLGEPAERVPPPRPPDRSNAE